MSNTVWPHRWQPTRLPSLGFSRQEHWSGLPFPSPVHESEKWEWSRSVMSDSSWPHGLTPPKKDVLCIIRDWNAKDGSQEITKVTGKFGLGVQNETRQRLTEFCQENILVITNPLFQQPKRWLYTWTSPDSQYWNQIHYVLCSWR